MSAEDLGMRELGQVRSQRLDELLTTLRLLHNPSVNSKVGIPALDRLLANPITRFDPKNLSAIPAPPIIEITSPGPKSGKTELLYWIIANLVLGSDGQDPFDQTPAAAKDDSSEQEDHAKNTGPTDPETGRQDTTDHNTTEQEQDPVTHISAPSSKEDQHTAPTAIALLTSTPISIPRLSQTLLHHLLSISPSLSLPTAQGIIFSALHHIHIFYPSSLSSLIATVSSLPNYFISPQNPSFCRRVGGIFIATPSSYFWDDRVALGAGSTSAMASKFPALGDCVKRVGTVLQTPVFYTTQQFSTPSQQFSNTSGIQDTGALRPLPLPYSLRLVVRRNQMRGFDRDVDAETAMREAEARDKAVAAGGFSVSVNGSNGNQGIHGTRGDTGFKVQIDGKGVRVL